MKKFAFAAVCVIAVVGFVIADEFPATITKVDGSKITYNKGSKKNGDLKEGLMAEAAANVKVMKGAKDDSGALKTEAVEKGLKDEMFANIGDKGVKATITTDDKGKITQIVVTKGKKKGGQ
jgi:hypothetical protein